MLIADSVANDRLSKGDLLAMQKEISRQRLLEDLEKSVESEDGIIDTSDSGAQMGRPLPASTIQRWLTYCNPSLVFEVSKSDRSKTGIYHIEGGEKRFVCGMESGVSPEFSIRHMKDKQIPDPNNPLEWLTIKTFYRETRGWRTILARLLREGLITEPALEKYFQVSRGRSSEKWQTLTT